MVERIIKKPSVSTEMSYSIINKTNAGVTASISVALSLPGQSGALLEFIFVGELARKKQHTFVSESAWLQVMGELWEPKQGCVLGDFVRRLCCRLLVSCWVCCRMSSAGAVVSTTWDEGVWESDEAGTR